MKNKENAIQFYKGIAIIIIALTHFSQLFMLRPNIINQIPKFGQMFTSAFFILSCFGLCLSYSKKKTDNISFYKKRISKIIVGYYIMIIIYLFIRLFISKTSDNLIEQINPLGLILNLLFLNGFATSLINMNMIVYGGWFIGAIVVYYFLFPFLYNFFVNNKNKVNRHRIKYIFVIEFVVDLILVIAGKLNNNLLCTNNSVIYFNFLNHLACFCLGFILFYYYNYNKNNKKILFYQIIESILFLIISIILFYGDFKYSYIFMPFCFGLFFINLYNSTKKYIEKHDNKLNGFICKIGSISWEIYLIHPVFVYFIFLNINEKLSNIIYGNDSRFILLLPVFYISVYIAALLLKKIINFFNKFIFKL